MADENHVEGGETERSGERPAYEAPRVQVMTEKEILDTFQVTQAMASWWGSC